MPLDITKLFVFFSANLFYLWNLWWSSVIPDCRKIEISSFNVCFAHAVILVDIVGAVVVGGDGSLFSFGKNTIRLLVGTSTIACSLQKGIKYIFQILNWFQYRKAIKCACTCVNESGPISRSWNGCTGSALIKVTIVVFIHTYIWIWGHYLWSYL